MLWMEDHVLVLLYKMELHIVIVQQIKILMVKLMEKNGVILPKPHNNLIKQNGHNVKLFLIMIELE